MIHVTTTIEIDRPAQEVFSFLADSERNPEWQKGMQSARWTSDKPIGVGSTYDQVARFMGKKIVTTFEVTAFEDGRTITITSTSGSFPIAVTRSVEALDGARCLATAEVSGDPSGFFKVAAPLMRMMVASSVRKDYGRLKAILESAP